MDWTTTSGLLQKLRDYDERTAWILVDENFRKPIVQLGLRRGLTDEEARDASQATLMAFAMAYREGKYDKDRGDLKGWLFGIANRQVSRAIERRRRRREQPLEDSVDLPGGGATESELEKVWEEEWMHALHDRAIRTIRQRVQPRTFEIFQAVALEGRSPEEVAREQGVRLTTVYNCVHRVSEQIRQVSIEIEQ